MTSTRRWNTYDDVNRHPDDSVLLAYLRKQKLETRSSVIQHIENEKCPVCFQKLHELGQVTQVLDTLGERRSYQYYPELTLADTYARIECSMRDPRYRQRPRNSALRLISIPVAFGLAILFTMAMLVFANLSGQQLNPFSTNGGTSSGHNVLTVVVPPHSIPTQQAKPAATAVVTPEPAATTVVTPDGTAEAKGPYIEVCSTKDNIAQLQLVICGFSFDSMHKAMLFFYVPGKKAFLLQNIPIDKHGKFHVMWNVIDCGNIPIFIFGYETTSSRWINVKLYITSFGSCVAPASPVVKPSWH